MAMAAVGLGMMAAGVAGTVGSGSLDRFKVGATPQKGVVPMATTNEWGQERGRILGRQGPTLGNALMARSAGQTMSTPYMHTAATTSGQGLGYQNSLAAKLAEQADGKGPSLASMQMQQGVEASLKAQQAAAASQRGRFNAALAMRGLGNQAADMQQQAALQSAQLRMQEQMAARQQLAGLSTSMRGQELGEAQMANQVGMFNTGQGNQFKLASAGFDQQANMFNADAQNKFKLAQMEADLRAQGMNDEQIRSLLMMQSQQGMANLDAQTKMSVANLNAEVGWEQLRFGADSAWKDRNNRFWGGMMQAGGSMMQGGMGGGSGGGMSGSDERAKTDIEDGGKRLKKFYEALGSHSYKYKDSHKDKELFGRGSYVSPMAQELERTELGKSMVKDTPDGKVVDYGKGLGAMLAGQAYLHREIEDLKRALKGKR